MTLIPVPPTSSVPGISGRGLIALALEQRPSLISGFPRQIAASLSRIGLVLLLVAGYLFYLAPFYWLWNELFVVEAPSTWRVIVIFQVAIILVMRWMADRHFRESIIATVLHPLGFSFLFVTALYAGARQAVGAGVQWKDRLYSRESSVK